MTVRAKFFVKGINHMHTGANAFAAEVSLAPVFGSYGDGKINESWSKYTPSGEIKMMITNMDAVAQFEVGKCYYVDFTPAD